MRCAVAPAAVADASGTRNRVSICQHFRFKMVVPICTFSDALL